MKLKRIMALVLSVGVTLITGCKQDDIKTGEKAVDTLEGKIVVWVNKDNASTMKASSDNFKKVHEKVSVEIVEVDSGDVSTKLKSSVESNNDLPSMICVQDETVQSLLKAFPNIFEDTSDDIKKDNYLKYKIDNLTSNNKIYGIPLESKPAVMLYRADILQAANVNSEYIKTWQDFIDAGKDVLKSTGKQMIALSFGDEKLHRAFLNQLGGSYFDNDGNPILNSQKSMRAVEALKRIYDSGTAQNISSDTEALNLIKTGKIASIISEPEEINLLLKQAPELNGKIQTMKLPAFEEGGNQSISLNGSSLLIINSNTNKKLALEFARFTAEDKTNISSLSESSGFFPAYTAYYDEKWFQKYKLFSSIVEDIYPINYTEKFESLKQPVQSAYSSIILNGKDIKITLDDLQKQIDLSSK